MLPSGTLKETQATLTMHIIHSSVSCFPLNNASTGKMQVALPPTDVQTERKPLEQKRELSQAAPGCSRPATDRLLRFGARPEDQIWRRTHRTGELRDEQVLTFQITAQEGGLGDS